MTHCFVTNLGFGWIEKRKLRKEIVSIKIGFRWRDNVDSFSFLFFILLFEVDFFKKKLINKYRIKN